MVAKAETKPELTRSEVTRSEMPPQPANHGTGNGVLGVLPASSVPAAPSQASSSQANSSQALALPSRPRAWLRASSIRTRASLSLSSAPTWMIQPVWAAAAAGLIATFCWAGWGRGAGSAKARAWNWPGGLRGGARWRRAIRRARHVRCHGWPAAAALGPGDFGSGRFRLGFGLCHHGAGGLCDFRAGRRDRAGDGWGRLWCAGRSQLHLTGLDLDGLDLDRLHRLGRARDCRYRLGLDHAAGQRRGFGLGLRSNLDCSGLACGGGRAAAAAAISEGLAGAIERVRQPGSAPASAACDLNRLGRAGAAVGFGDIGIGVGGIAFGDRGDRARGCALVEVFGEQIAHDGIARTAAAAAQHHADQMAVAAAHRGHEIEAGSAGVTGLDAVDAFDIAEQAVVVADRLAAIIEHAGREVTVVAREAILDRAAERRLIARGGDLFIVGQAVGVAIDRLASCRARAPCASSAWRNRLHRRRWLRRSRRRRRWPSASPVP